VFLFLIHLVLLLCLRFPLFYIAHRRSGICLKQCSYNRNLIWSDFRHWQKVSIYSSLYTVVISWFLVLADPFRVHWIDISVDSSHYIWCLYSILICRLYWNRCYVYGSYCLVSAAVRCVLFVATQCDGSAVRSSTCNANSLRLSVQFCFHSCTVVLRSVQWNDTFYE